MTSLLTLLSYLYYNCDNEKCQENSKIKNKKKGGEVMENNIEELAREERRAYNRKWRMEHKNQIKQHQENYWKRKALKRLQEEKQ